MSPFYVGTNGIGNKSETGNRQARFPYNFPSNPFW